MDGYKWKYFLLLLSFVGWVILPIILFLIAGGILLIPLLFGDNGMAYAILSLLLSVIGLIYVLGVSVYLVPYYQTTLGGFYRELTDKEKVQEG